jgi:S-adenosylmethionine decarboxylase
MAATELLIDALHCNAKPLADLAVMRALCDRIVSEMSLVVVGAPQWHAFSATALGPGGVTGLYLLSESHLSVHTWPERNFAAFNLCCCRPRPEWPWKSALADVLGARDVVITVMERGP